MTVLVDDVWTSADEWRVLHGLGALVAGLGDDVEAAGAHLDALGRHWDPLKHPRGRDGKFIEVGGQVRVFDALRGGNILGLGTVEKIDNAGIHVKMSSFDDPARHGDVGREFVVRKEQIASIPHGQVRLDRNGNIHPNDRELPDANGKLIRPGDQVRHNDGREGVVGRVGERNGDLLVHTGDGGRFVSKAENVARLDHPNPAQVRPHEQAAHDAHVARVRAGEVNLNEVGRRQAPRAEGSRDAHGHAVPDGWERHEANGNESFTKDGYRVTPFVHRAFGREEKKYRVERIDRHGRAERVSESDSWTHAETAIGHDRQDRAHVAGEAHRQNVEQLKPTREQLHGAITRFGGHAHTHDAVQHGTSDEAKAAIANDENLQRNVRDAAQRDMGVTRPNDAQRAERRDLEHIRNAQQHGVKDEHAAGPRPVAEVRPTGDARALRDHDGNPLPAGWTAHVQPGVGGANGPARDRIIIRTGITPVEPRLAYSVQREGDDLYHVRKISAPGYRVPRFGAINRNLGDYRTYAEVKAALERDRAGHAPAAPPAHEPVPTALRNLPAGRQVRLPDDARYSAAAVDQMLTDLPRPVAERNPVGADRYLRNLRLALQDSLTTPSQRGRDGLDARIGDYFRRAAEGRPAHDPTLAKLHDVKARWDAMRAGNVIAPRPPSVALAPRPEGAQLANGAVVVIDGGAQGRVVAIDHESNRAVVEGPGGVRVIRDADQLQGTGSSHEGTDTSPGAGVSAPTPDEPPRPLPGLPANAKDEAEAIAAMHVAGAGRGFPYQGSVASAKRSMEQAVQQAESGDAEGFAKSVEQAVVQYNRGLESGIRNRAFREDVIARRNKAQDLLERVTGDRGDVDPVLGVSRNHLSELRGTIPRRYGNAAGATRYAQGGYALGDALDTARPAEQRQAALQRADERLAEAAGRGHANAIRAHGKLQQIKLGQAPGRVHVPRGPNAVARAPRRGRNNIRVNDARPVDPNALNPDAKPEDYAQTWGIDRATAIARAARERPSMQSLFDTQDRKALKDLAARAFNGEYGSGGLQLRVTTVANARGRHVSVAGKVYQRNPEGKLVAVGHFQRELTPDQVYNASFVMNKDVQGSGAASEFNRHMEDWYIANGVQRVTVSAAGGGGIYNGAFVWARNGFDWNTSLKTEVVNERLNDIRTGPYKHDDDVQRQVEEMQQRVNLGDDNPNFPTPFDISQIGWEPHLGSDVPWAGKEAMVAKAWSGVKELDPNARAYQRLVQAGRLPDPSIKEHPVISQYDASAIPDDLRAISLADLQRAGRKKTIVGNFEVVRAGSPSARGDGRGHGVNAAWFVTDRRDGKTFIVKNDTLAHERGADAEVGVSELLRGTNYYGASYVERHPTTPTMVISTFAGAQHGTKNHSLLKDDYRSSTEIFRNMADQDELIRARVVNAVIANGDRHGGNAMWGKDADGKDHLLLFDHGLSLDTRFGASSVMDIASFQRIAYDGALDEWLKGHDANDTGSIEQYAQQLMQVLQGMAFSSTESKDGAIRRLQEILDDPQKFLDALRTRRGLPVNRRLRSPVPAGA